MEREEELLKRYRDMYVQTYIHKHTSICIHTHLDPYVIKDNLD